MNSDWSFLDKSSTIGSFVLFSHSLHCLLLFLLNCMQNYSLFFILLFFASFFFFFFLPSIPHIHRHYAPIHLSIHMRETTNTTCICKRKTNIVSHSVGEIRTKASRLFYTSVEKIKRKNFFLFFLLIVWSIYRRFAVRRGANVYERREYNINFISSFLHFLREIFFSSFFLAYIGVGVVAVIIIAGVVS